MRSGPTSALLGSVVERLMPGRADEVRPGREGAGAPTDAEAMEAPPASAEIVPLGEPAGPPDDLFASVEEIARAFGQGDVDRLMVLDAGTEAMDRDPTVGLARRLVASGSASVLIDMTGRDRIAAEMGLGDDSRGMREFGAGEASLAEVIHRDCHTRAHVVPSTRYDLASAEPAQANELGLLLSAFSQAYDYAVLVCRAEAVDRIAPLLSERTAVLIASSRTGPRRDMAAAAVRALGIDDIVVMADEPATDDAKDAPRADAS